mmetsp:Transcript_16921/g.36509  ORF Transcript_16921/g.36509 Transcript_16921/m.36509 type:complete len:139 (-) Transcript_16921:128-544(-)
MMHARSVMAVSEEKTLVASTVPPITAVSPNPQLLTLLQATVRFRSLNGSPSQVAVLAVKLIAWTEEGMLTSATNNNRRSGADFDFIVILCGMRCISPRCQAAQQTQWGRLTLALVRCCIELFMHLAIGLWVLAAGCIA